MRYLMPICAPLLLALASCTGLPIDLVPGAAASATTLDETALTYLETAYKAERLALDLAADAGLLHGAAALRAADLDQKAFTALLAARRAYSAVNATDYVSAIGDAHAAIVAAVALVRNNGQKNGG